MGTKFKSNVGTQSNASGLDQVPPGIGRINQSFLNRIGRTVDRATLRFSSDSIFQQLSGGTVITPLDQSGSSVGVGYPHPFKVLYAGKPTTGSKVFVRILEGHIIGRVNGLGTYTDEEMGINNNISLGLPGLDLGWEGGWPSGPEPDTSAGDNPNNPGNTTTDETKSGAGTHYTTANGYQSGNAGSVIKGWTQYNGQMGNAGSLGGFTQQGNAGSITNPSQGNSGIYHTPIISGNAGSLGGYVLQGNAGSIVRPGNSSGIYHTPTKSGNAGSIFAP